MKSCLEEILQRGFAHFRTTRETISLLKMVDCLQLSFQLFLSNGDSSGMTSDLKQSGIKIPDKHSCPYLTVLQEQGSVANCHNIMSLLDAASPKGKSSSRLGIQLYWGVLCFASNRECWKLECKKEIPKFYFEHL